MKELPIDAAVIGLVDKVEAHSKKYSTNSKIRRAIRAAKGIFK